MGSKSTKIRRLVFERGGGGGGGEEGSDSPNPATLVGDLFVQLYW